MARRLVTGLLALTAAMCAQRRVDPKNTYVQIIGIVSMIGRGTPDDHTIRRGSGEEGQSEWDGVLLLRPCWAQ